MRFHRIGFEWTAPYERVVYWDKFGHPPGYITRIGDYQDLIRLWWFDPARSTQITEALRNLSLQIGAGPSDDRHWLEFARRQVEGTPGTR